MDSKTYYTLLSSLLLLFHCPTVPKYRNASALRNSVLPLFHFHARVYARMRKTIQGRDEANEWSVHLTDHGDGAGFLRARRGMGSAWGRRAALEVPDVMWDALRCISDRFDWEAGPYFDFSSPPPTFAAAWCEMGGMVKPAATTAAYMDRIDCRYVHCSEK